ncbi:hypothetical protein SHO565_59990 [Streptomyces sp. HO565]
MRADMAYDFRRAAISGPVVRGPQPPRKRGSRGGRPRSSTGTTPSSGTRSSAGATLKRHRAAATRYDKLAVRYEATVQVAAVNERL